MIDIVNETLETDTPFTPDEERFTVIACKLTDRPFEMIFTTDETIQKINREHRGKDAPTDVLSFPYEALPHAPLGSMVVSVETAERQAKEHGNSLEEEITLLFIHGLLHLLGYDHEMDKGEMREEEARLVRELGLPDSLIVRSGES